MHARLREWSIHRESGPLSESDMKLLVEIDKVCAAEEQARVLSAVATALYEILAHLQETSA